MAFQKPNNISQVATGSGTGALALGAVSASKYKRVQDVVADGDSFWGRIQSETNPSEHEETLLTRSGNNITRTWVSGMSTSTSDTGLTNFTSGTFTVTSIVLGKANVMMDSNGDATVTRNISARQVLAVNGAVGYGAVNPGGVSNGGYFASHKADGTRIGYIGWGNDSVHYVADMVGAFHVWYGPGAAEWARLNSTGLGIGVTPTRKFHVVGTDNVITTLIAGSTKGVRITPSSSGVSIEGVDNTGAATFQPLYLGGSVINVTCSMQAGADNSYTLGSGSFRWSTVYAATGTINTSDGELKVDMRSANAAERRAAKRILDKGPVFYRFAESVAEKGDAARIHVGYVAQDVRDALEAEGLDPWRYGFMCADDIVAIETYTVAVQKPKMRKVEVIENAVEVINGKPVMVMRTVERDEPAGQLLPVTGQDGKPVMVPGPADEEGNVPLVPMLHFIPEMETVQEERTREVPTGEKRLGLRYSELEAFLKCAAAE